MINKNILVVDDHRLFLNTMKRHLARSYENVTAVPSGEAAINALTGIRYDLVLLDINMPGIDGWEVLAVIKAKYPSTRVIISSSCVTKNDREDVLKKGAFDLIEKPFEICRLDELVELALCCQRSQVTHAKEQCGFIT